jgi:malate synthase
MKKLEYSRVTFPETVSNLYPELLTEEALKFIADLQDNFNESRLELLKARKEKQKEFDKGKIPCFEKDTNDIRESEWVANEIPHDLQDRRVEITGPVNRKMVINALNSGAKTFMADFEDSNSPTWENTMQGQLKFKRRQ